MSNPTQYPTLDKLTAYLAISHCDGARLSTSGLMCSDVAAELTALKAERDALTTENVALNAVVSDANETMKAMDDEISALKSARPKSVRKLREYVSNRSELGTRVYRVRDGVVETRGGDANWRAQVLVWVEDILGVADLLANPHEPVETVEDVLRELAWAIGTYNPHEIAPYAARLRAARDAETGGGADA